MAHEIDPLPYAYNALEPHIDEQTMQIHHDKLIGNHARTQALGLAVGLAAQTAKGIAAKELGERIAQHAAGNDLGRLNVDHRRGDVFGDLRVGGAQALEVGRIADGGLCLRRGYRRGRLRQALHAGSG